MDANYLNNPAFLAFRAAHKSDVTAQQDNDDAVKEVTIKEEGKTTNLNVKNEE